MIGTLSLQRVQHARVTPALNSEVFRTCHVRKGPRTVVDEIRELTEDAAFEQPWASCRLKTLDPHVVHVEGLQLPTPS